VNTHYRDDAEGNHQIKFVPAKLSDHMKPHIRSTKLHIRISEERTVPQSRHGRGWVLLQIISGFIEFDINSSTRILPSCWRALFCPIAPSALLIPEGRFLDGAREAFMKSMEGASWIQYCSGNWKLLRRQWRWEKIRRWRRRREQMARQWRRTEKAWRR
jgi:hypothetical protein